MIRRILKLALNVFHYILLPLNIVMTYFKLQEINSPENRAFIRAMGYELNNTYPTVLLIVSIILFIALIIIRIIIRKKYKRY